MWAEGVEVVKGHVLVKRLGQGAFGEVWLARGPGGVQKALKLIELSKQGVREYIGIKRVMGVTDPHLVKITDIWALDENFQVLSDEAMAILDNLVQKPQLSASDWQSDTDPGATSQWFSEPSKSDEADVAATMFSGDAPQPPKPLPKPKNLDEKDLPKKLIVAMILCDKTLGDRLQEAREEGHVGIPVEELLSYMRGAARGIDHLTKPVHPPLFPSKTSPHIQSTSLSHGDIKPDNIMILGSSAALTDYSLANVIDTSEDLVKTEYDRAAGTPYYMAPEVQRKEWSTSMDQYSLAITYYQLRTGEVPFPENVRDNGFLVMKAKDDGDLDFSQVSRGEQKVLARATALDPSKRFPSCEAMIDALEATLFGTGKPGWVLPLVATLLLTALGALGYLWFFRPDGANAIERYQQALEQQDLVEAARFIPDIAEDARAEPLEELRRAVQEAAGGKETTLSLRAIKAAIELANRVETAKDGQALAEAAFVASLQQTHREVSINAGSKTATSRSQRLSNLVGSDSSDATKSLRPTWNARLDLLSKRLKLKSATIPDAASLTQLREGLPQELLPVERDSLAAMTWAREVQDTVAKLEAAKKLTIPQAKDLLQGYQNNVAEGLDRLSAREGEVLGTQLIKIEESLPGTYLRDAELYELAAAILPSAKLSDDKVESELARIASDRKAAAYDEARERLDALLNLEGVDANDPRVKKLQVSLTLADPATQCERVGQMLEQRRGDDGRFDETAREVLDELIEEKLRHTTGPEFARGSLLQLILWDSTWYARGGVAPARADVEVEQIATRLEKASPELAFANMLLASLRSSFNAGDAARLLLEIPEEAATTGILAGENFRKRQAEMLAAGVIRLGRFDSQSLPQRLLYRAGTDAQQVATAMIQRIEALQLPATPKLRAIKLLHLVASDSVNDQDWQRAADLARLRPQEEPPEELTALLPQFLLANAKVANRQYGAGDERFSNAREVLELHIAAIESFESSRNQAALRRDAVEPAVAFVERLQRQGDLPDPLHPLAAKLFALQGKTAADSAAAFQAFGKAKALDGLPRYAVLQGEALEDWQERPADWRDTLKSLAKDGLEATESPWKARAHFLAGVAEFDDPQSRDFCRGQIVLERAIGHFKAAQELEPALSEAGFYRSMAHLLLANSQHFTGEFSQVRDNLLQARALAEAETKAEEKVDEVNAYIALGNAQEDLQLFCHEPDGYDAAIRSFETAVSIAEGELIVAGQELPAKTALARVYKRMAVDDIAFNAKERKRALRLALQTIMPLVERVEDSSAEQFPKAYAALWLAAELKSIQLDLTPDEVDAAATEAEIDRLQTRAIAFAKKQRFIQYGNYVVKRRLRVRKSDPEAAKELAADVLSQLGSENQFFILQNKERAQFKYEVLQDASTDELRSMLQAEQPNDEGVCDQLFNSYITCYCVELMISRRDVTGDDLQQLEDSLSRVIDAFEGQRGQAAEARALALFLRARLRPKQMAGQRSQQQAMLLKTAVEEMDRSVLSLAEAFGNESELQQFQQLWSEMAENENALAEIEDSLSRGMQRVLRRIKGGEALNDLPGYAEAGIKNFKSLYTEDERLYLSGKAMAAKQLRAE